MNNYDRVEVKLYKKSTPIRDFELTRDKAEVIEEAIRFYWLNAGRLEGKMMNSGSQRLRMACFNLKRDLQEILDILYGR